MSFFLILCLFFIVGCEILLFFRLRGSKYFKNGPTGDASAYYFHYKDWQMGGSRSKLLEDASPLTPYLFFGITRTFETRFLYNNSFYLAFIFKYIATIVSVLLFEPENIYEATAIILFVFLSTPSLGDAKSSIQFNSFSPRLYSAIICSLLLVLILIPLKSSFNYFFYIIIILIVLNGSFFSKQHLVFVSIPVSIIYNNIDFYISLSIGLCIAMFSRRCRHQIIDQLNQIKISFKINEKKSSKYDDNNSKYSPKRYFAKVGILNTPEVIRLIVFTIVTVILNTWVDVALLLWILLTAFCFKRFKFLGEAWRYISYSLPILMPLAGYSLFKSYTDQIGNWIIIALSLFYLFSILYLTKKLPISDNKEILSLFNKLNKVHLVGTVFAVNFRQSCIAVNGGFGTYATEFPIGCFSRLKYDYFFDQVRGYPFLSRKFFINEKTNVCSVIVLKDEDHSSWIGLLKANGFRLFSESQKLQLWLPVRG
jgi:hypothetical protein